LSFENSGSRILNNKNLEAFLAEYPNLKRLTIRGSRRISLKQIAKNIVPWWDVDKWKESELIDILNRNIRKKEYL
ncbi:19126_t:CDS:2, partial [Funneliformis geosporum]